MKYLMMIIAMNAMYADRDGVYLSGEALSADSNRPIFYSVYDKADECLADLKKLTGAKNSTRTGFCIPVAGFDKALTPYK